MNTVFKWILIVLGACIYTPIILGGDEAADRWLDCILSLLPRQVVLGIVWIAVGAVALGATTCAVMIYLHHIRPFFRNWVNSLHTSRRRSAL